MVIPLGTRGSSAGAAHDGSAEDIGQGQFFYSFNLDEVVPPDHLVRQIDGLLDLSWVHEELAPYYSHTGRPWIDPVLMIRMLLVGYIFADPLRAADMRRESGEPCLSLVLQARYRGQDT